MNAAARAEGRLLFKAPLDNPPRQPPIILLMRVPGPSSLQYLPVAPPEAEAPQDNQPATQTAGAATRSELLPTAAGAGAKSALSLAQRLEQVWTTQLLAPVTNQEMPRAIDALMAYHLEAGFFGERFDGMERFSGFGPAGTVEVALAPNRKKVPIGRDVDGHGNCGLCKPPFPEERGLIWGTWRVWPNAFPYVPADSQHIILTHQGHLPQSYSPQILADMVDFQNCAAGGEQLTMHYNGTAGNSQIHLHWQATRETLPLQRQLDSGRMPLTDLRRDQEGRIATYDQDFYAGLVVEGDKPYLVRWATRIIARLNDDPTTRGAYNLLLLKPRAGRLRLVIVPRRADHLKPEVGSIGKAGIGAFNTGGIIVLPRAAIPGDFADAITPAMRSTIVPPRELAWLGQLSEEPRVAILNRYSGS